MTNEKNLIVQHLEWAVLLVTLLGGFYMLDGKIERQAARTDKLYEIWVDTQKEIKDLYVEILKDRK